MIFFYSKCEIDFELSFSRVVVKQRIDSVRLIWVGWSHSTRALKYNYVGRILFFSGDVKSVCFSRIWWSGVINVLHLSKLMKYYDFIQRNICLDNILYILWFEVTYLTWHSVYNNYLNIVRRTLIYTDKLCVLFLCIMSQVTSFDF